MKTKRKPTANKVAVYNFNFKFLLAGQDEQFDILDIVWHRGKYDLFCLKNWWNYRQNVDSDFGDIDGNRFQSKRAKIKMPMVSLNDSFFHCIR